MKFVMMTFAYFCECSLHGGELCLHGSRCDLDHELFRGQPFSESSPHLKCSAHLTLKDDIM